MNLLLEIKNSFTYLDTSFYFVKLYKVKLRNNPPNKTIQLIQMNLLLK